MGIASKSSKLHRGLTTRQDKETCLEDHDEMYQCQSETEGKFRQAQRRQQPLLGSVCNNEGCAPAAAFIKCNPHSTCLLPESRLKIFHLEETKRFKCISMKSDNCRRLCLYWKSLLNVHKCTCLWLISMQHVRICISCFASYRNNCLTIISMISRNLLLLLHKSLFLQSKMLNNILYVSSLS